MPETTGTTHTGPAVGPDEAAGNSNIDHRSGETHAAAFADLARLLRAASTPQATVELICRAAVFLVPGAQHACITVMKHDRFSTAARTDSTTRAWDRAQYESGQGPCPDALTADVVVCDDVGADGRWPDLQARIAATGGGVRSVLSLRLFLEQDTVGALTLYSTAPAAFTSEAQAVAAVFATHAAVAIQAAQDRFTAAHLQAALDSNRQIGAAIGILMSRENITNDAAFQRLRQASQNGNRKLRDVADDVIFTGHLAPIPTTLADDVEGDDVKGDHTPGAGRSTAVPRSPYRRRQGWPGH